MSYLTPETSYTWKVRAVKEFGEDASWQILSEDGTAVLRTWRYSDRDLPNQRFFDESSWSFAGTTWTFEILPDDILSD